MYQEFLTLGQWLSQDDRRALYKYLLKSKKKYIRKNVQKLLADKKLITNVANGEILYRLEGRKVSYSARKIGSNEFTENIRTVRTSQFKFINLRRLCRFFCQCEVDVISNFPLPGVNTHIEDGFTINTYPFYDLNYYSDGKGKVVGLIKKIRTNDSEQIRKLAY